MQITEKGLKIVTKEGKEEFLKADNIVLQLNQHLTLHCFESPERKVLKYTAVGDCKDLV